MDLITTAAPENYIPPGTAIKHDITASLIAGERPGVVHITQYDQTLPIIAVRLMGNNVPYAVPVGAAVNFRARKPDGKYIYNPALGISADRSTAYIAVTPQTAAAAGKMRAVIEIVVDAAIAATASISIEIAHNPVPEDAIESQDEYKTIWDLLQQTLAAAEAAKASEEAAADSAVTAAKSASNAQTSATQAANSASEAGDSAATAQKSAQAAAASEEAAAASATAASDSAQDAESSAAAAADSEEAARQYAEKAQQIAQGAKGWYENEAALQEAHPTGVNGDWAIVGTTDTIWVWDSDTNAWKDTGLQIDMSQYYTKSQVDQKFEEFLLRDHPVGSLHLSGDPTSPAILYGGTWIRITNAFIWALADGMEPGSTGGSSTINLQHLHSTGDCTLTTNQIPSHYHSFAHTGRVLMWDSSLTPLGDINRASTGAVQYTWDTKTAYTGGGDAHNHGNTGNALSASQSIMPPYYACYCWQRTA